MERTHHNGNLRLSNVNEKVTLVGWVAKRRNLGSLVFMDLRDRSGIVQLVFDEKIAQEVKDVRNEYILQVKGTVLERKDKNPKLATGDIEVKVEEVKIVNSSLTTPIIVADDTDALEDTRLKYRYLDLRRSVLQKNLMLRHKICMIARNYLSDEGFIEVETPILCKSTPEGARDYLVPSRMFNGKFYALPQSPQIYKQLLMIAGMEKYFQIARCFRDEDLRADRQPEFTQIDLEMSFADEDTVIEIQEGFLKRVMKEIKGIDIETPFPRLTYAEAMERFGSDKPDTRFGIELVKLNDLFEGSSFEVFTKALSEGGDIRGICVPGGADKFARKKIDKLVDECKHYGAKGLVWIKYEADEIKSSVSKFFSQDDLKTVLDRFGANAGDIVFICSDKPKVVFDTLGFLRRRIAGELGMLDDNQFNFLWVVDFPMFEADDEGNIKAMHHPFTQPKLDELHKLDEGDILGLNANAYDIVLNGVELGGGSVRIHDRELQAKMFEVLGLTEDECQEKFGFLIEAFKYGAPPHAGLAYGLDRLVMLLLGEKSIREVIAFPKNQNAECPVCEAPAPVDEAQLKELGITISVEEESQE